MKTRSIILSITAIMLLFISACKKGEKLEKEPFNVVRVTFNGSSSKNLEIIYKDSVIGTLPTKFGQNINLAVGTDSELKIREAGSTAIIATRKITTAPFEQTLSLYYDGISTYEKSISYLIKGFAMSGELEFLIDGQPEGEGSMKIEKTLTLYMNGDMTRELTVRKKGETVPLISKTIGSSPATGQSLKFFFDGTAMVDNIQLNLPENPANMLITAQFKTQFTNPNSNTIYFTGGTEADLVFYTRKKSIGNNTRATPETRVTPEIRVTVPLDGKFVSFELPPLTETDIEYTFDICQKGTNAIPYILGSTASSTFPVIMINEGRYGTGISFETGASRLLLIKDIAKVATIPTPRHRIAHGENTDLSQYFK